MAKLFGVNRPDTNLRKNGFDLSSRTLYTQSPGMLVPVFCRDLNPGEKVRLSLSAFTRTQPLNSSAFVRSKQYFHFFFVPYRQLWNGWQNFINGVDYKTSSLQNGAEYSKVPSFSLFSYIHKHYYDNRNGGRIFDSNSSSYRDPFGYRYIDGISRLMDMLGFGFTLLPMSSPKFSSGMKIVSNLSDLVDEVFYGGGDWEVLNIADGSDSNWIDRRRFNIFRFLAYQKIYSDFYKRDDYEATDPLSFNIDDIYDGKSLDSMNWSRFLSIFQLRYRWLPKDLISGVVPSELFNSGNMLSLGRAFGVDNPISMQRDTVFIGGVESTSSNVSASYGNEISTRSIRAAFALEKMYKLTRRAQGHDYISQTAAHYGFVPPKGLGDKVQFLGGYSNDIDITDVVTTAETEQSPAGAIFGKGQGSMSLGDDIDFTANEHGVLMCISSIVPELDYSGEGMDPFNVKFDRGDYFQPEFQDLGLQPIFGEMLENYLEYPNDNNDRYNSAVLGYVPRYAEYKTAMDVLHGEFRNQRSLAAWSATTTLEHAITGLKVSSMRIHPSSLDRIFSVKYNGKDVTDQFMTSAALQCRVIRPMSITGQTL